MEFFASTDAYFAVKALACLVVLFLLLKKTRQFTDVFKLGRHFSRLFIFTICWLVLETLIALPGISGGHFVHSKIILSALTFFKALAWIPLGVLVFELVLVAFSRKTTRLMFLFKYLAYVLYALACGALVVLGHDGAYPFFILHLSAFLLLVVLPMLWAAFNCFLNALDGPPTKEKLYANYVCISILLFVLITLGCCLLMPYVIEGRVDLQNLWRDASLFFAFFLISFYFIVAAKMKYRRHSKMVFTQARAISDGIVVYASSSGKILFSNAAVISLLQLPNETIRKRHIREILPLEDSVIFEEHSAKPFSLTINGRKEEFLSIVFFDTILFGVKCCILKFSKKLDDNDIVYGVKEMLLREQLRQQAILEKMREEIRRKEVLLQTSLDNMPMQISVKNEAGVIILQNKEDVLAHGKMLGLTEGSLQDAERKAYDGEKNSFEAVEYADDMVSIKRSLNYTYVPIADAGKVGMVLKICRDVTDQMNLNIMRLRLLENEKRHTHLEELGTLAGTIAHEFNNISGAQLGFLTLAKSMMPADTPGLEYLDQVEIAGKRSKELIDKLLQSTRTRQDEEKGEQTVFYVEGVVKNALAALAQSMPDSITVENSITHSDVKLFGSDVDLRQILSNIFNNAVYAMREKGGVLSVSLKEIHSETEFEDGSVWKVPAGDYACIKISDTGEGIPSNVMQRLFSPLFTTKPPGDGLGLGLYTSISLVRAAHGEITVQTTLGKGSTFKVYWPLSKNEGVKNV